MNRVTTLFAPAVAGVALAFASVSAHATITPIGTSLPGSTGVYVAVYDTSTKASELVNLDLLYANAAVLTPGTGVLVPDALTGTYQLANNPTGATGQVLQMDYGVLPNFSTIFPTVTSTTQFAVVGAAGSTTTSGLLLSGTTAPVTNLSISSVGGAIISLIGSWASAPNSATVGYATDAAPGGNAWNANNTTNFQAGALTTGANYGGAVGTALNFYSVTTARGAASVVTALANSTGTGFWFLSSSGDLTWNVPTASGVPLPAAAWLLLSGLVGLVGVGRRNKVAV